MTKVEQTDVSPSFAPGLVALTWALIAVWLIASLADPAARASIVTFVATIMVLSLCLYVLASIFPSMRFIVRWMGRVFALLLGLGILAGFGAVRGARATASGGRGAPRDLLITVRDDLSREQVVVRFARANPDVSLAAGNRISATGVIAGSTLLCERIDVETGLGTASTTSGGRAGRIGGYIALALFGLLALQSLLTLIG